MNYEDYQKKWSDNQKIDREVAIKIFGLPELDMENCPCPYCGEKDLWRGKQRNRCTSCNRWLYSPYKEYTEEIESAWEIIEKLTSEGWCPGLIFDDNGHWALSFEGAQSASCGNETMDVSTAFFVKKEMWFDTAPLAICHAALAAKDD